MIIKKNTSDCCDAQVFPRPSDLKQLIAYTCTKCKKRCLLAEEMIPLFKEYHFKKLNQFNIKND